MDYFQPNAAAAQACRRQMDDALWASVSAELSERSAAAPGHAAPSARGEDYAAYSDLSLPRPDEVTLDEGELAASADYLAARLADAGGVDADSAGLRITNLADYGRSGAERLKRWWDVDPANRLWMAPLGGEQFAAARAQVATALDRLGQCAPELLDESAAVVSELVLLRPDSPKRIIYDGGSSFATWGAVALNADAHAGWVRYFKSIVHEAGHNLLFGLARDEPLVENDPGETFASPVRDDARPLDGIFHAMYVMAREAYGFDRLLAWDEETGGLTDDEASEISTLLTDSVVAFWQCMETLRGHARMTPLGAKIIDDCEDYMRANFALVTE